MMLLSWFDVRKTLAAKTNSFTVYPAGIVNIQCFSDAVEVESDDIEVAETWFADLFKHQWDSENKLVHYDIADSHLAVEFAEAQGDRKSLSIRPLWQDVGYINQGDAFDIQYKNSVEGDPGLMAFYSFKGGVGRTTALLTYLSALIDNHRKLAEKSKKIKLLLVDADLEAPGITYLLPSYERAQVSWIQFMESMQYPVSSVEKVVDVYARELKKVSIEKAGVELFILPAFSGAAMQGMSQIADVQIKPEHLTKAVGSPWHCTDIILSLTKKLGADYALVDLRAGLSELSSPLLFDPRVERFVVTTMAEQAICGTEYVLSKMAAMVSEQKIQSTDFEETKTPTVITTFVTKEFRDTSNYEKNLGRLMSAYEPQKVTEFGHLINIVEGEFSSQLLHISTLDEYISTITSHSSLYHSALAWAKSKNVQTVLSDSEMPDKQGEIGKLKDFLARQIAAKNGVSDGVFVTKLLRNLAKRHVTSLPNLLSIGAQGSGKTFNFMQMCTKPNWYEFVKSISPDSIEVQDKELLENTLIFPLTFSSTLDEEAKAVVERSQQTVIKRVGGQQGNSLEELLECIEQNDIRVIFIVDGLEEFFLDVNKSDSEKELLFNFIDVPGYVWRSRKKDIGMVAFIREGNVEKVREIEWLLSVEYGQGDQPYDLTWNSESFLKFVYWTCQQAGLSMATRDVQALLPHEISQELTQLWGAKLGKPNSTEAHTIKWVYAALADFKGQVQPGDIIGFLACVCEHALTDTEYSDDRLLTPESLAKGLVAFSAKRVETAKAELPAFASWTAKLVDVSVEFKSMPFSAGETQLEPDEFSVLMAVGIIYEEQGVRDSDKRYYLPELYRQGLGFTITAGVRSKIQLMLKESLDKLPVDV